MNCFIRPSNVLAAFGVALVAPCVSAGQSPPPGLPIDLAGSYLAVKNHEVAVTTDPHGIYGQAAGDKVLEPAPGFVSAPFSNLYRPPTSLSHLSLVGHSYWFTVDLGSGLNWPNPSSIPNWFAGQAALGEVGTELQVRASASTASGIDIRSYNGLTVSFYQKDGRYWGHVSNLWYDQDVDIPYAADATQYYVKVSLLASDALTITFTQKNGAAAGASVVQDLVGGSTDEVGLTSASFMVALYNQTSPTVTPSNPSTVKVSGFGTDAVPNALYAFSDTPYLNGSTLGSFRLDWANLTTPGIGYQASLKPSSASELFPSGAYQNTAIFNEPGPPPFPQNGSGVFNHAQNVATLANETAADLLLETYSLGLNLAGPVAGPFYLNVLPLFDGVAPSEIFAAHGVPLSTSRFNSNAVMLDTAPPVLTDFAVYVNGQAPGLVKPGQVLTVTVHGIDHGSGFASFPTVTVSAVDINNNPVVLPVTTLALGLAKIDPVFEGSYTVPTGVQTLTFTVNVTGRSGLAATPLTTTVSDAFCTKVHLVGATIPAGTTVQRVLRVVLAGSGMTPIPINKVVTFDSTGTGYLGLTATDRLPVPVNPNITELYVKDPYHTLGKATAVSIQNGAYLAATSEIDLTGGDINNDDVVDVTDLACYATFVSDWAWFYASTTTLEDFAKALPVSVQNPDFNADGQLDDVSFIVSADGLVGDPDPARPAPPTPKTSLTIAQATALGMPAWVEQAIDVNHDGILTFQEILNWIKSI